MKPLIILGIIFLVFLVAVITYRAIDHTASKPQAQVQQVQTVKSQPQKITCTRTTRLPNDPQYDRALSLIAQRIDNHNKYSYEQDKFKYFPTQLTNCIKVIESDVANTDGAEGYFIFGSKDIKPNYFPIYVDKSYYLTDDVLTALLLSHEITHVQQYIDQLNGKPSLSCYDREVEAFRAQLAFYTTLNTEENSSVLDRVQNEKSLSPELQMLNTMFELNRSTANECDGKLFTDCNQQHFLVKLQDLIHETYKKECSQ